MKAATFVLLVGAVPATLAGCGATAPKTASGSDLYGKMLARCDNGAIPLPSSYAGSRRDGNTRDGPGYIP